MKSSPIMLCLVPFIALMSLSSAFANVPVPTTPDELKAYFAADLSEFKTGDLPSLRAMSFPAAFPGGREMTGEECSNLLLKADTLPKEPFNVEGRATFYSYFCEESAYGPTLYGPIKNFRLHLIEAASVPELSREKVKIIRVDFEQLEGDFENGGYRPAFAQAYLDKSGKVLGYFDSSDQITEFVKVGTAGLMQHIKVTNGSDIFEIRKPGGRDYSVYEYTVTRTGSPFLGKKVTDYKLNRAIDRSAWTSDILMTGFGWWSQFYYYAGMWRYSRPNYASYSHVEDAEQGDLLCVDGTFIQQIYPTESGITHIGTSLDPMGYACGNIL